MTIISMINVLMVLGVIAVIVLTVVVGILLWKGKFPWYVCVLFICPSIFFGGIDLVLRLWVVGLKYFFVRVI